MKQEFKARVPIADLIEYPGNPRQGDLRTISESIDAHGFYGAVLVQKSTNRIIAGNHRTRAAKDRGDLHVPVLFVDVDDDEASRIMLVDNRSNDAASYDTDLLVDLLQALDGDLTGTGYQHDELAALLAAVDVSGFTPVDTEDNPRLDERAPTVCPKCGHVWS